MATNTVRDRSTGPKNTPTGACDRQVRVRGDSGIADEAAGIRTHDSGAIDSVARETPLETAMRLQRRSVVALMLRYMAALEFQRFERRMLTQAQQMKDPQQGKEGTATTAATSKANSPIKGKRRRSFILGHLHGAGNGAVQSSTASVSSEVVAPLTTPTIAEGHPVDSQSRGEQGEVDNSTEQRKDDGLGTAVGGVGVRETGASDKENRAKAKGEDKIVQIRNQDKDTRKTVSKFPTMNEQGTTADTDHSTRCESCGQTIPPEHVTPPQEHPQHDKQTPHYARSTSVGVDYKGTNPLRSSKCRSLGVALHEVLQSEAQGPPASSPNGDTAGDEVPNCALTSTVVKPQAQAQTALTEDEPKKRGIRERMGSFLEFTDSFKRNTRPLSFQ
ncbi:hypothetical protein SARC_04935, partial [Sphaeroforma arctica JP610]